MDGRRKFLFVTLEGGGNVPPVLGVVGRLVSRGHEVMVLTEPCLRAPVEKTGARFVPFERHFTRQERTEDLIGDSAASNPVAALQRTFRQVVFGPARIVAEETRQEIDRVRPDVVVVDAMLPGALPAAEAAGVPRVLLFHMPEYLPGPGRPAGGPGFLPREDLVGRVRDALMRHLFLRQVARWVEAFNDARRAMGLPPHRSPKGVIDEYHRADLRLIQTTEAFDFPAHPPHPNVRYVGPMLDDPDWVGEWADPFDPGDARPLVVVGLSSTFQNQARALQNVATALGTLDVRGLITLGPAMADLRLALPANVVAVPAAPHTLVFPGAAAVITHAGHGTVMRAVAHGLPLLCLPMGRDQNDNGARVVHAGVGLRLRPTARPHQVASGVRRLLSEPAFREAAAELQRAVQADAERNAAVAELEALASSNGGPRRPTPAGGAAEIEALRREQGSQL